MESPKSLALLLVLLLLTPGCLSLPWAQDSSIEEIDCQQEPNDPSCEIIEISEEDCFFNQIFTGEYCRLMMSPDNLDYGEESLFLIVGDTIQSLTPSFTGDGPQNWLVNPRLPDGLTLDDESGVISGTPEIELISTRFTIIATNAVGSSVFIIDIQILPAPPNMISYGDNVIFCTLNQFCGINNPMTSGGEIEGWEIIPNLPDGLEILDNGEISGVIQQLVDSNYTITASNSGGSVSTILRIIYSSDS